MTGLDLAGGLVLLHGFTGAPESFDAALALAPPSLDPTRVLRPPLLGHGGPVDDARDFDAEVDRLAALVAADGALDAPHLVGYSLGGRVALGLLVRHPSLFRGATLIGTHPGLEDSVERRARLEADARWARLLEREGLERFVAAWEELPLFATQRANVAPDALAAQRARRLRHDPRGLAAALRVLGLGSMPPRWAAMTRVAVPVRWLVGARDDRFRVLAERAAGVLPRASADVVADVGHNVLLESPRAIWGE